MDHAPIRRHMPLAMLSMTFVACGGPVQPMQTLGAKSRPPSVHIVPSLGVGQGGDVDAFAVRYLLRGALALQLGDGLEALESFRLARLYAEHSPNVDLGQARAHLLLAQTDKAIQAAQQGRARLQRLGAGPLGAHESTTVERLGRCLGAICAVARRIESSNTEVTSADLFVCDAGKSDKDECEPTSVR